MVVSGLCGWNENTIRVNDIEIHESYRTLFQRYGLDSLDALFRPDIGTLLSKPGLSPWRERVRLTLLDEKNHEQTFYLKRFLNPPARCRREVGSIAGALSVAEVECRWMRRFQQEGIPAPLPVVFGHELIDGREIRSAIVSKAVPGKSLEYWVTQWTPQDKPSLRPLADLIADTVRAIHRNGFVHRDLYLSHIFFDPGSPLENAIHIIDLQRVVQPRWFKQRAIIKDLAALNYSTPVSVMSLKDRIRWLKRYLGLSKLGKREKRFAAKVYKKTKQIERHDRKRQARFQQNES